MATEKIRHAANWPYSMWRITASWPYGMWRNIRHIAGWHDGQWRNKSHNQQTDLANRRRLVPHCQSWLSHPVLHWIHVWRSTPVRSSPWPTSMWPADCTHSSGPDSQLRLSQPCKFNHRTKRHVCSFTFSSLWGEYIADVKIQIYFLQVTSKLIWEKVLPPDP